MGILTFDNIKREVLQHHANRSDAQSRLNIVVDMAMMRIARLHDWDQLKLLLSGTLAVTATARNDKLYNLNDVIPAGYRLKTLYSVRLITADGRSQKLLGKTHLEFDQEIPEPEFYARGLPIWYTVFGTRVTAPSVLVKNPTLELWRVPDVAYNMDLRLQVWPRFLTDGVLTDADYSDLMADDAVIALATSYLYNSYGREDKAKWHFGIYSSIVRDALNLDETDFHTVIAGVNVRGGTGIGDYVANPFVSEAP
jgi:hypothetical protein